MQQNTKVQYDMEGNVLPVRNGCCYPARLSLVWILLGTALVGGFLGTFCYYQYVDRFQQAEVRCAPVDFTTTGTVIPTEVTPESPSPMGTTTEAVVAFLKTDIGFLVANKEPHAWSVRKTKDLVEYGSCVPAESMRMLDLAPEKSLFVMRVFYDQAGQCVFAFLRSKGLFKELNTKFEDRLLEFLGGP